MYEFNCRAYDKTVNNSDCDEGVECDICQHWYHISYKKVTLNAYQDMKLDYNGFVVILGLVISLWLQHKDVL